MSYKERFEGEPGSADDRTGLNEGDLKDSELEQVLSNFRSSVRAWSEAEYSRPRAAAKAARGRSWRLAAGWALGCALVAGGVGGGVYERHQRLETARIAAVHEAEQKRLAVEEKAREEEELLAKVDSDVSREVPSAMEPLAQLMAEDETQ
jgi:uncharacterized protein HemX